MFDVIKPYYETENGKLYCGDCLEILPYLPNIDLTITSPPYDNLRAYKDYNFDFQPIADRLFDIIKDGGVVVWVVGDATINGSETGTSFKQALYFKEIGFNLYDTMIYSKYGMPNNDRRYEPEFEYMFILSKGKPNTFNPIKIKTKYKRHGHPKKETAENDKKKSKITKTKIVKEYKIKGNIWHYQTGYKKTTQDDIAFKHPAIFPDMLAQDHILSWSNEGDTILDLMAGSGTVPKMCEKLNRKWLACEISEEYCEIAVKRIENERKQRKLF